MATGLASTLADEILDALGNNSATSILPVTAFWIQLHVGDPGAAGTGNQAGNATREQVSFGAATGGTLSNDADVSWTTSEVDTSEDYTHWSAWTASTAGTFLSSGTVSANAVTAGDQFTLPAGEIDLAFNVAS